MYNSQNKHFKGNSCDELPLPGSLLVLVPESCRSRVQDPGIVLAKAELDVPKEGQKAEFRYFNI